MDKFQSYVTQFDLAARVTDEDVAKTQTLLQLYAPSMRRAARHIEEMEAECYESRAQSITDFINLAIDYDNDADRKKISDRLAEMGHSMQLLSILEETLLLVKAEPSRGGIYFDILKTRYFDAYCHTNEEAYLTLGISSATFYRNLKKAIRVFAGNLWYVIIPDMIIAEQMRANSEGEPPIWAS